MSALKKKIIHFLLLIAVIIAAVSVIRYYVKSNDTTYSEYISSISELMNEGDYDKAVEECSRALKKYTSESEFYLKKAEAYYLDGDIQKASGTLDYGYKMTGDSRMKEQRDEYDNSSEIGAEFHDVQSKADPYRPESETDTSSSGNEINNSLGYGGDYVFPDYPYAQIPEIVTQPPTEPPAVTDIIPAA